MIECKKDCKYWDRCDAGSGHHYQRENCPCFQPVDKKQTNADRIRAMTDEELAEFFYKHMQCNSCCVDECVTMLNDTTLVLRPCELRILDWLRKDAE